MHAPFNLVSLNNYDVSGKKSPGTEDAINIVWNMEIESDASEGI